VDCGGVWLPAFTSASVVTGYVRGGVPTTLSGWLASAASWSSGATYASVVFPGGTASLVSGAAPGQESVTFTPDEDGVVTITTAGLWTRRLSGLMLTEGDPSTTFMPGGSMPCQVDVSDPEDVLLMIHSGTFRHDYAVTLREVG
jgi:hypothetical protein